MLTADLVNARRRAGELKLVALDAAKRARAVEVAAALVGIAEAHVGRTREEMDEAVSAVDVGASEERVKAALAKLVEDRCSFDALDGVDPCALREDLFVRAAASRAAGRFDRAALIAEVASVRGLALDDVERGLYADLRASHLLRGFEAITAESLVDAYEHGQAQAVLLRAVKVTIDVRCASAGAARALFHRLKFLRLLYAIERTDEGHRIVIDGPFSLFESVTKYGLQLAMVLPALEGCEAWSLVAEIRWGKERTPLTFKLDGSGGRSEPPALTDDVATLVRAFKALKTAWRVAPSTELLDLPGVGLCVPDLVFKRGAARVYLEVMGFWSRAAVWRRVELVEAGLKTPILFAVSSRLRVSEEVLDASETSALYVYKGTMSARAVAERLEGLARGGDIRAP